MGPVGFRKPAFAAAPIASRRYARATFAHAHSRAEKVTGGFAAVAILALVIAGLVYTVYSVPSAEPARTAASDRFPQTRTARIVVPTNDGRCKEYAFYNDSGLIGMDRVAACDHDQARAPKAGPGVGFESFKQAFGKK
jgi:hypothetical protein